MSFVQPLTKPLAFAADAPASASARVSAQAAGQIPPLEGRKMGTETALLHVVRSYDSTDCSIMVRDLAGGKFLVSLHSGPVSIRCTVTPEALAHLFNLPVAHSAAGVAPIASSQGAA